MPVHHQGEGTVAFIIFNDLIEGIENNMGYIIRKMTKRQAEDISTWKYDEPYSIYDMDGSKEILYELLDGSYYAVTNEKDELTGYFCFGDAAQVPGGKQCEAYLGDDVIDIGLGMRPDLTGKGMGLNFLYKGLKFVKEAFSSRHIRLTVATFNKRAIKVYEKLGFKKEKIFKSKTKKGDLEFMSMSIRFDL